MKKLISKSPDTKIISKSFDKSLYEVGAGVEEIHRPRHIRLVQVVIVHEKYTEKTYTSDIALLKLDKPFEPNQYVQLIELATFSPPDNAIVTIAGFGSTEVRHFKLNLFAL